MANKKTYGRAEKGSQFWIQMLANTNLKTKLDEMLGVNLTWISPRKDKNGNYPEYQLKDEKIWKDEWGLTLEEKEHLFEFWPKSGLQPVWDGIATSENEEGKTLYLVEAKSHIDEMKSSSGACEASRKLIIKSIKKVCEDVYHSEWNEKLWMNEYYQLGNRLTFLHKLKNSKELEGKFDKVKLVLLNFADDYTHNDLEKSVSIQKWEKHYEDVFEVMTGSKKTPENVIVINFSVAVKGVVRNPMTGDLIFSERYE